MNRKNSYLLKTTKTFLAPQRNADVAQSKAVSPAPKTKTVPYREGSVEQATVEYPFLEPCATSGRKSLDV